MLGDQFFYIAIPLNGRAGERSILDDLPKKFLTNLSQVRTLGEFKRRKLVWKT